jgi:hypothetical protein
MEYPLGADLLRREARPREDAVAQIRLVALRQTRAPEAYKANAQEREGETEREQQQGRLARTRYQASLLKENALGHKYGISAGG